MRKVLSKSLLTAAATTGALAGAAGYAQADAGAGGGAAGSPGVGSGNVVQAPVHVPASVCGNTVNIVALLNPAFGNKCVNGHTPAKTPPHHHKPREEPKQPPKQQTEEEPPENAQERPPERAPEKPAEPVENRGEKPADPDVGERAPKAQKAATPVDSEEAAPTAPRAAEPERTPSEALAETGGSGVWGTAALGVGTLLGGVVLYRRSTRLHA
ncbi:chaplin family protein [Streptomyces smyrnaeus]|uniref:chaplin n=1 Tax=Streptomyces smyrnaeus TaxID=1387713 RepID=UPI0033C5C0D9